MKKTKRVSTWTRFWKIFAVLICTLISYQTSRAQNMISRQDGYSISDSDENKVLFWTYNVAGIRYSLYKVLNKDVVQQNADGTPYYESLLTLTIKTNVTTTTYVVGEELFMGEGKDNAQTPCIAIDLNTRMLYVFANSKRRNRDYSMDGYIFVSSLDNINFQRETVFTGANWGWWPYFTYNNGTLSLQHFSFAGYYAETSTRNSNGSWSTQRGGA